jgi:hypothetical protein
MTTATSTTTHQLTIPTTTTQVSPVPKRRVSVKPPPAGASQETLDLYAAGASARKQQEDWVPSLPKKKKRNSVEPTFKMNVPSLYGGGGGGGPPKPKTGWA